MGRMPKCLVGLAIVPMAWVAAACAPAAPSAVAPTAIGTSIERPPLSNAPAVEPQKARGNFQMGGMTLQCDVFIESTVTPVPGGYRITASARNVVSHPVRLVLTADCPGGFAHFEGLRNGYDPYKTCTMGACQTPRQTKELTIGVGERVVVGEATIDPAGDACNSPYDVRSASVSSYVEVQEGDGAACPGPRVRMVPGAPL